MDFTMQKQKSALSPFEMAEENLEFNREEF